MTNPWFRPDLSLHPEGCPCNWCTVASGQPRPRVIHPKGCRCQGCADLRAAVGRGMDKHIAKTMAAKERGKTRAEQIITDQAHREGAARAQVTRELAGWGAYPYRTSDDWHEPGCGCGVPRCSHIKALDEGAAMAREQLAAEDWGSWHEPGCGCGCEKPWKPPETIDQVYAEADARGADPVWQWQEVTRSIVLPDYGQLITAVPDQPPGTCKDCRTGPLFAGNQCWYCSTRDELKAACEHGKRKQCMACYPTYRCPCRSRRNREHSQALSLLVILLAGLLCWTWLTLLLVMTGVLG